MLELNKAGDFKAHIEALLKMDNTELADAYSDTEASPKEIRKRFEGIIDKIDQIQDNYNKFNDKSNNTESAILEILGVDVTYHQEYMFSDNSNFIEKMKLEEIPKYGWETTPVTLEIKHSEFGTIGLKTEIYEPGQLKPRVIVEQK